MIGFLSPGGWFFRILGFPDFWISGFWDFRILGFRDFGFWDFGFQTPRPPQTPPGLENVEKPFIFLNRKRTVRSGRSKCRKNRPEIVHMRRKTKEKVFGPSSSFPGWTGHPRLHIFPGRRRMAFSPGYNFPGSQAKNYSQVPRFVSPGSHPGSNKKPAHKRPTGPQSQRVSKKFGL